MNKDIDLIVSRIEEATTQAGRHAVKMNGVLSLLEHIAEELLASRKTILWVGVPVISLLILNSLLIFFLFMGR